MRPLLLVAGLGALAGAQELMPINDLRVGVSVGLTPSVQEELRTTAGTGTSEWSGGTGMALRYHLDYFNGLHRRGIARAGFLWGVGVLYGDGSQTPDGYDRVSGAAIARTPTSLTARQYGASLYAGYATVPSIADWGEWTLEFLPVARGGYAWAETVDPAGGTAAGGGHFWELGGQIGWTVQDKGWLLTLFTGASYGQSEVRIDLAQGGRSILTLTRLTPEAGLAIGGRF